MFNFDLEEHHAQERISEAQRDNLVICRLCRDQGNKSRVNVHTMGQTLMTVQTFFDEDGRFHSHDPNGVSYLLSCNQDSSHRGRTFRKVPCPAGDYGTAEWSVVWEEIDPGPEPTYTYYSGETDA